MFHMTLLYPMQLLDELPMIFSFSSNLYALIDILMASTKLSDAKKSPEKNFVFKLFESRLNVFLLLITYCGFVSFIYINIWTDPVFHQTAFGVLVFLNIVFAYKNAKIYNIPKKLFVLAIFYFLVGFLFWNLDNHFCSALQYYRHQVQALFSIEDSTDMNIKAVLLNLVAVSLKTVSEFHSLWHVFTAYSSFVGALFLIELDYERYLKENRIISRERPVVSKCCGMVCYITTVNERKKSKNVFKIN
jgi:hypothetical protein